MRKRTSYGEILGAVLDRAEVDEDGCWIFTGARDGAGYGQMAVTLLDPKKPLRVHRIVWMVLFGDIPAGFHVHHTCEVKSCCNPSHLALLDASTHHRLHARVNGLGCQRGHSWEEHGRKRSDGKWTCRKCDTDGRRRRREAAKVPCAKCATPRLHERRYDRTVKDSGLCRACYQAARRVPTAASV